MKPATVALIAAAQMALAQASPARLTLKEAEELALKNHPQVLAAENEAAAAGQGVREARSAYYPDLSLDITASAANHLSRIGAGSLTNSRMFNRLGEGIVLSQLVTDFGRTPNLVASSRLHAQATVQDYQRSRCDVLLAVSRSYFDYLHAQALLQVADQTVAARQLLLDQVSALAKNNLKSQLDVSFTGVNVSQARLLLIRAQDSVQTAAAELMRALGSDQPATYQLVDEPLPPSPSQNAEEMVAQALANRPELASVRLSRDAAYKLAAAETDLSLPTVSLLGVAGILPLHQPDPPPPRFPESTQERRSTLSSRSSTATCSPPAREAARQRALQSDQMLRDEHGARGPRRAVRLGQRHDRLPADRRHRAVPPPGRPRSQPGPGPLQSGPGFDRRADPGAIKRHPGRSRESQRQVRLSDTVCGAPVRALAS